MKNKGKIIALSAIALFGVTAAAVPVFGNVEARQTLADTYELTSSNTSTWGSNITVSGIQYGGTYGNQSGALMLTKNTGYFYNKTAITTIKKITLVTGSGISGSASWYVTFSSSSALSAQQSSGTQTTGPSSSTSYSYDAPSGSKFFCISNSSSKAPQFSKVVIEFDSAPVKTLSSIAVSGTMSKKTYYEGDAFSPAGLTVTGTYSDGSTAAITEGIQWAITPSTASLGTTSVSVVATAGGKTSPAYQQTGITVQADALQSITLGGSVTGSKGQAWNLSGVTLTGTYVSGNKTITSFTPQTTTPVPTANGTYDVTVTVSYGGLNTSKTYSVTVATTGLTEDDAFTVAEALPKCTGKSNSSVTDVYYVKGKIVSVDNTTYGNIHISDTGTATNQLYVYGLTASASALTKSGSTWSFNNPKDYGTNANTKDLKAGDTVLLKLRLYMYSSTSEGDGIFIKKITKTISSIAITTQPTKKAYLVGEAFDKTGMVVTATYSDGSTANVTSSCTFEPATIAANTSSVAVNYTFEGKTVSTSVTGIDVLTLSKITVEGQNTSFRSGQAFSFGGTVYPWYTHSSGAAESKGTALATNAYTVSKSGTVTKADNGAQVTVTYQGKTANYNISVGNAYVTGVVMDETKTASVSNVLELTASVLPEEADQGVTFSIDTANTTLQASEYTLSGSTLTIGDSVETAGVIVVIATSNDVDSAGAHKTATCTISVASSRIPVLTSITVGGELTNKTQYTGHNFNPAGLTFTPVYDIENESPDVITGGNIDWDELVAGNKATGVYHGVNDINVEVTGITVVQDGLDFISITGDMNKKSYYNNASAFDFSGLSVSGVMLSGDDATITQANVEWSASANPADLVGTGKTITVTATYGGKTATKDISGITVTERKVTKLEVTAQPKTSYILGEDFTSDGLVVKATYNDGSHDDNFTGYTLNKSAINNLAIGTYQVNVELEGALSASFNVTYSKLVPQEAIDQWTQVTSAPTSWVGEYLIGVVDGTNAKIYNGTDAEGNYETVAVSNGVIAEKPANAVSVKVESMSDGYSVQVVGGNNNAQYMYGTSGTNKINFGASASSNGLEYTDTGVKILSNTMYFLFNSSTQSGANRFRYYKPANLGGDGYLCPTLFKYEHQEGITASLIGLEATTTKTFKEGQTLNISDLTVNGIYNSAEKKPIASGVTFADGSTEKTLQAGENTFEVQYIDGGKTFTTSVTVNAAGLVKVSGITITGDTTPLFAGQTKQLAVTVAPADADNKEVTWSSADQSIATVSSSGLVTAVGANADGTTVVIKATAKDGNGAYGEFTVTVNKDDVNGIQLAESNAMKTSFIYGETFDPSGLVIQEVYESGKLGNTIAYAGHESDFTLGIVANKVLDHDDTSCSVSYGGFALANPIALTINKKAVSLEVTGYNDSVIEGTDYEIGDDYTATVTFSDNTTDTVTITEATAADTSTFGTTTVTAKATVGGVELTDTFNVTVEKDIAVRMTVDKGPEKYDYNHNETFNGEGVKITVTFASGKTEEYHHGDEGVSYNLSTLTEVGSKTLEVSYTDKYGTKVSSNAAQPIIVSKVAESLAITGYNDSIYAGQVYELGDDAVATVTYSDGTTGTIDIPNDVVVNIDNETVGTATASVTINGLTATFDVTVKEDEVERIKIFSYDGENTYTHKEPFNAEGLVVTVTYKSGNTEDVYGGDERLSYSPATFETVGENIEVKVTFTDSQGNTAETYMPQKFTVVKYVDEVALNSYELYKNYDASGTNTPLGDQDPIYQSDNITAKVVVDVTYSDGSTGQKEGIVSLGGLVQGNNAKAITFEGLEGKQVNLNINGVLGDELTGLTVDTTEMKVEGYIEGQSVDFDGLVITGHYATGAEKEILLSDCTVTGDANLKVGSNEIKLEFDGKEVTFNVNAVAKSVTGIELVGTQAETYFLESELANIGANGYQIKVTYDNGTTDTIDITNAMVSHENGVVTVTYEGKTDTYEITVLDKSNIASITIENESGTATKDVAYTFNPGTVTAHYEGTNKTLVLDAADYTVDAVAVSEVGDATYDVTLNGTDIKASFTVSVSYADVTGVTISGEVPEVIRPNDQVTLTATVAPENANGEVTWSSSDETVATVENGVVTFLKEGTVTITATSVQDPTQKATKELSCEAIHVTDVVIAEEAVEILEGNNATLHVTVNPEDAANPAVTFTSGDETIATVDANGVVTGVKFGTTTITVTSVDGGKTDTVVIVVHVKINGVTITDEVKESYLPKETLQLHATVDCSDPSQGVIWSTSNKLIATVTEDGLVRFFKDGKVVITATSELDPTKSASIELVVHTPYVAMTELQVAQGEASMVVGDELQLNWTIAPVDATDMTLKFVSNNEEVAKVDENGLITAVGPGTTTINISSKDGSLTATCEVTVVAKVTGVSLNETTKTIEEGQTFTLTATVNPENAPNKAVTWETSDASIATVNNGVVTALKAGEVTITVKTNDGNKVASCVVTVTAKPANQGDNGEGGAGVIDNVLNKLGCKGSIAATSALISLATLAGAGLALSKKRKKEDK